MMKILMFFLCFLTFGNLPAQEINANDRPVPFKYFNEKNQSISKAVFQKKRSSNKFLEISGDSAHHKKLTIRVESGQINDVQTLFKLLENAGGKDLDESKPLVIIYYPGKDSCNSGGSATPASERSWHEQLEEGIYKIAQSTPIYIYKNRNGLENFKSFLPWKEDPGKTIERLFFKYHYPCSSFTVIAKDGKYISHFGEFGKENVWAAIKQVTK